MSAPAAASVIVDPEIARARDHAVYRAAFGVTGCFAIAEGLGWTLPVLAAALALSLLTALPRAPTLAQGLIVFMVIVASTGALAVITGLLIENVPVILLVLWLIMFLTFFAHFRGAPNFLTFVLQVATIMVPMFGATSMDAAVAFVYVFWKSALIAIVVVWVAFAAFPVPTRRPQVQSDAATAKLDAEAAARQALICSLVIMPMFVWYLMEETRVTFFTLIMAVLLLRERSETGRSLLTIDWLRSTILGGLAGILAYCVIIANGSFPFMVAVMLLSCLMLAWEATKGGRYGAMMLLAFQTFVLVFGMGIGEASESGEFFVKRFLRLIIAVGYVVGALSLLEALRPRKAQP